MVLGTTGRDRLTGFSGVITARCEYITGCHQLLLQPPVDEKGTYVQSQWFDEQRVEITDAPAVTFDNARTPGPDVPAPRR